MSVQNHKMLVPDVGSLEGLPLLSFAEKQEQAEQAKLLAINSVGETAGNVRRHFNESSIFSVAVKDISDIRQYIQGLDYGEKEAMLFSFQYINADSVRAFVKERDSQDFDLALLAYQRVLAKAAIALYEQLYKEKEDQNFSSEFILKKQELLRVISELAQFAFDSDGELQALMGVLEDSMHSTSVETVLLSIKNRLDYYMNERTPQDVLKQCLGIRKKVESLLPKPQVQH